VSRKVVIVFGRFNPPTTGHERLFHYAANLAVKTRSDFIVFPTQGTGKNDPLPPKIKGYFLRRLFPDLIFSNNAKIRTIVECLTMLARRYRDVTLVVGSDRAHEFAALKKYVTKGEAPVEQPMPPSREDDDDDKAETKPTPEVEELPRRLLHAFRIVAMPGRRDAKADGVKATSASKQRGFAAAGDYASFRKGVPTTNERLAEHLFKSVRHYMGLRESKGPAFLLFGTSPKAALPLREAFTHVEKSRWRDVTGKSFADIKALYLMAESKGYAVKLYTRDLGLMTESVVRHKSTLGRLKEAFARDIVDVQHRNDVDAAFEVCAHARAIMEAAPAKPKVATEKDKLKMQHGRELLLTKQRQGQELLAAQQRELTKKTQEASSKIASKAH